MVIREQRQARALAERRQEDRASQVPDTVVPPVLLRVRRQAQTNSPAIWRALDLDNKPAGQPPKDF